MKKLYIAMSMLIIALNSYSQVGIGTATPDASSVMDISGTSAGLLIPRMTKAEREAIVSPATGLMVFQTNEDPGLYINMGTSTDPSWETSAEPDCWLLNGNSGTTPGVDFIGTTDDQPLMFRTRNLISGRIDSAGHNTSFGYRGMEHISTGQDNLSLGFKAGASATGTQSCTAVGSEALKSCVSGSNNTAIGKSALMNVLMGDNTAVGENSLRNLVNGSENVAVGNSALVTATNGTDNVAVGYHAMNYTNNTSGLTAVGSWALYSNTTGIYNVALGKDAMYNNTTGSYNTAIGTSSLYSLAYNLGWNGWNTSVGAFSMYNTNPVNDITEAVKNTSVGAYCLYWNTTGYENTAIGHNALFNNTTGYQNTAIGERALQMGVIYHNSTAIGFNAQVNNDNQIKLGDNNINSLYCTGAYNSTSTELPNVVVNEYGQIMRSTASKFNLGTSAPPSASDDASGNIGDIRWDSDYIYIKTGASEWKRAALSTW